MKSWCHHPWITSEKKIYSCTFWQGMTVFYYLAAYDGPFDLLRSKRQTIQRLITRDTSHSTSSFSFWTHPCFASGRQLSTVVIVYNIPALMNFLNINLKFFPAFTNHEVSHFSSCLVTKTPLFLSRHHRRLKPKGLLSRRPLIITPSWGI